MPLKSEFVCHKSRGSRTIFSVKVPLFQGIFTLCDPSFLWHMLGAYFFANMGGGGCRNCFHTNPPNCPKVGRGECERLFGAPVQKCRNGL